LKSREINRHFQQLSNQRQAFLTYIHENVEDPWQRSFPDKWSFGETTYHLMLLARLVRRVSTFYLPMMLPYAYLRKSRPFKTETHNIYKAYNQTKRKPMKAPFVLIPPANLYEKYSFQKVQQLLEKETDKIKKQLDGMEENIAGQIRYPDPVANYPNVIQSVHLLAIHEQHHFDLTIKYHQQKKLENK